MSHFRKLILGLCVWDTPTINVLGHSSEICSVSVPFPSLIWLNTQLSQRWANDDICVSVVRVVTHDRKTVHPELFQIWLQLFPSSVSFCLSFLCALGCCPHSLYLNPLSFPVLTVQLILYPQCLTVNHSSHTGYDLNCSSSCLWTGSLLSQLHTMTKKILLPYQ